MKLPHELYQVAHTRSLPGLIRTACYRNLPAVCDHMPLLTHTLVEHRLIPAESRTGITMKGLTSKNTVFTSVKTHLGLGEHKKYY